jgi:hypothetical protein
MEKIALKIRHVSGHRLNKVVEAMDEEEISFHEQTDGAKPDN